MSVTDQLFKTIDYAIDKKTKKLFDQDISGIVVGINSTGSYQVLINDVTYEIPNGCGLAFKSGDLVWVHSPNGDFNKKFIISARSSSSKEFNNESSGDYGPGSSVTPEDIITNAEIDAMFE